MLIIVIQSMLVNNSNKWKFSLKEYKKYHLMNQFEPVEFVYSVKFQPTWKTRLLTKPNMQKICSNECTALKTNHRMFLSKRKDDKIDTTSTRIDFFPFYTRGKMYIYTNMCSQSVQFYITCQNKVTP